MIATQPGCSKGKKQKLILFFSFPPLCSLPQRLLVLAHALCPPPKLVFLLHFFTQMVSLWELSWTYMESFLLEKTFTTFPNNAHPFWNIYKNFSSVSFLEFIFSLLFLWIILSNKYFLRGEWNHNFHGIQLKIFVFIGSKNIWKLSKLWQFGHLHSSKHLQMSSENAFFNTV